MATSVTDRRQFELIEGLTARLADHEKQCAARGADMEARLSAIEAMVKRNQHLLIAIVGGLASGLGVYLVSLLAG